MAYDEFNPPALIGQGVAGGARFFDYSWTDPIATVLAAGYITNALDLGLRVGDSVRYHNISTPDEVDCHLIILEVDEETGAGTLAFPAMPEEAVPLGAADPLTDTLMAYIDGFARRVPISDLFEDVGSGVTTGYVDAAVAAVQADVDTKADIASPVFTGNPRAPTPVNGTNDTSIATTAFVRTISDILFDDKAPKASPAFTGNPTAPTPTLGDNDTSIATTGFVQAAIDALNTIVSAALGLKANIASPTLTGNPRAPTPVNGTNDTSIATTAFVRTITDILTSTKANLASPVFTGNPTAPTPSAGDNDTSIATTAFVKDAIDTAQAIWGLNVKTVFGCACDSTTGSNGTDDTAAFNTAVAYANAHPYTTLIIPGHMRISKADAFTVNGCRVVGSTPGSQISHSGTPGLTWTSGASYGGISNITLNNVGANTNVTLWYDTTSFMLTQDVKLGTGIATLAQLGTLAADIFGSPSHAAGGCRFNNLTGIVSSTAPVPLFKLYNGVNWEVWDIWVYPGGQGVAGRNFCNCTLVAPAIFDWQSMRGVQTFYWDTFYQCTVSGSATASGPIEIVDCLLDSMVTSVVAILTTTPSYIGTFKFQNNWATTLDGNAINLAGSGLYRSINISDNVFDEAGERAILIQATGAVEGLVIADNILYSLNTNGTASTGAISISGDSEYRDLLISNNQIQLAYYAAVDYCDYGLIATGAIKRAVIQGNSARGTVAAYSVASGSFTDGSVYANNAG